MKKEFVIDLKGVKGAKALQNAIAENLPVPEHYGRNLDAFYDVLTEYGADWRIVFLNAQRVGESFKAVCRDAKEATPGLEIVFGTE